MDRRPLATPTEAAQYLNVPTETLKRWRLDRRGPRYSVVGRHVRYRWDDIEKWLDEQARTAA